MELFGGGFAQSTQGIVELLQNRPQARLLHAVPVQVLQQRLPQVHVHHLPASTCLYSIQTIFVPVLVCTELYHCLRIQEVQDKAFGNTSKASRVPQHSPGSVSLACGG